MKLKKVFFSCTILFFLISLLFIANVKADTVFLKNGDIISGNLVTFGDGLCIFNTKYGSTIKIYTNEIINLYTKNEYEVLFVSGEKIKGRFTPNPEKKTVLASRKFGKLEIDPANISSLIKIFSTNESAVNEQGENQTFGKKEEKSPPLNFLTGSTVLLSPGIYEVEMGLMYKQSRLENSLTNIGYFQRSAYTARRLEAAITGRAGLYNRLEGWLTIRGTYSYVQDVSSNAYVRDTDSWDLGDISGGLQYLLFHESETFPAFSALISVNAPTGEKNYNDIVNRWKDPLDNGNGHWGLSLGLSFVKMTDPAILFGGFTYQHSLPSKIDGYDIDPRWNVNGYLGIGFALNEKLSLGGRFGWGYSTTMIVDGNKIHGSDSEPMDISFSASYRLNENWVTTPEVTYSLNDDAGTPSLSLKIARRF